MSESEKACPLMEACRALCHCYLIPIITTTNNNVKNLPPRFYASKNRTRREEAHRRALKDDFNFSLAGEPRNASGQFVDIL